MWSKQENEILKRNIDDYLKTNNIASAEEVIFELSKEERKDFYRTIGIEKVNIKLSFLKRFCCCSTWHHKATVCCLQKGATSL